MTRRRTLALALLLQVVLAVAACDGREAPRPPAAPRPEDAGGAAPSEPDSAAPLSLESVRLYFPSASADGLVAEAREILHTTTPGDRAKQIVSDLLGGPSNDSAVSFIPTGTRLQQVFVVDSTAYVDFSEELRAGIGGGSDAEILTVYSIVNSLALNISEIERVGILVGGRHVETLNGHLDLRRPLRPDEKLIFRPEAGGEPGDGKTVVESALPPRPGA